MKGNHFNAVQLSSSMSMNMLNSNGRKEAGCTLIIPSFLGHMSNKTATGYKLYKKRGKKPRQKRT